MRGQKTLIVREYKMRKFLASLLFISACQGSGSGSKDDPIGGSEGIKDTYRCSLIVPSLDEDGRKDPPRGFELTLTVVEYDKGSSAVTLYEKYTFKDKETYETVSSRAFTRDTTSKAIDTDFHYVKLDTENKFIRVYRKFDISSSFEMECE